MIRFWLLNTEFRVHVLTFIAAILAVILGIGNELPCIAIAVGFHELMHLIAAKLCGIKIEYIEIMWFGGAAHVKDIYSVDRSKIIVTAVAGPFANLILIVITSALAWWEYIGFSLASLIIRTNLMLMIFNLMPVMPLDGGRVFYAVTSLWIRPSLAVRLSVGLAHLLATCLAVLAVCGWYISESVNITLLLMAVFLIASSLNEMHSYESGKPGRALEALCSSMNLPAQASLVAYPGSRSVSGAAGFIRHDKPTIFAIVESGSVRSFVTGEEMARRILEEM